MHTSDSVTTSRFELQRRLGAGGFGEVFEAWDHARNSTVALKRLMNLRPESVRRFKHEFRSLAGLSHPNLVQLYELVSDGEDWSFTMELIDGQDFVSAIRGVVLPSPDSPTLSGEGELGDAIPVTPQFDEARLRGALRQLIRGVRALHAAGKLHRDLKPHNVLVTDAGRVVILDFGMVRELRAGAESGVRGFVGTPHYMAPEQSGEGEVTTAADWYSVGVMLYEVLVGEYPVQGRTVVQLLLRKQLADAPEDSAFPPDTPPDLRRACQALLERDPTARPDAEELLELLGDARDETPTFATREIGPDGPFVGREAEVEKLAAELRLVANEAEPRIAAIVGESGIGKSALGWHFAEGVGAERGWVLSSRCWENESVPYKAMDGIVDELVTRLVQFDDSAMNAMLDGNVAALARVFPAFEQLPVIADFAAASPSSVSSPKTRQAAFRALRGILRTVAHDHPLTLLIDDAQWGDRDSAEALVEIVSGTDAPRLFILLTFRGSEADESPFVQTLVRDADRTPWTTLELAPLDDEVAAALARECGASAARAAQIVSEAHGDPYLVQQLVDWSGEGVATVESLIERRLQGLPADEFAFLELLSMAAKPIDAAILKEAAATETELPHTIARLRNERLLRARTVGGEVAVEPYHDRIRQAVRASVAPARRRNVHLRLAQTLERRSARDPELLALHFRSAGERVRSAPYARKAADQALEMLAYDRAAEGYVDALRDGDWADQERCDMQSRLGTVLSYLGRGNESAEAFVRAAALGDEVAAIGLRRSAAEQLLRAGQFVRGRQLLDSVLSELGIDAPASEAGLNFALLWSGVRGEIRGFEVDLRADPLPPLEAARIDTIWVAANLMGTLDVKRGAFFTLLNVRHTLECGDPERLARTLALQAVHSSARTSSRARAPGLLEKAAELVPLVEDSLATEAIVDFFRGMVAYMTADVRQSHRWFVDVERRLARRASRFVWERKLIGLYDCFNLYQLGLLPQLEENVVEGRRDAASRNDVMQLAGMLTWGHLVHLMHDDPAGAIADVERAHLAWNVPNYFLLHDFWRVQAEARIALYSGEPQKALDVLSSHWPGLRRGLMLHFDLPRALALDLRARAQLALAWRDPAQRSSAIKAAQRDIRRLSGIKLDWCGALVPMLRAQVALLKRDREVAATEFAQAEAQLGAHGFELALAALRVRLGELLGDRGQDLRTRTVAWFEARGVENPARFVRMIVPVGVDE